MCNPLGKRIEEGKILQTGCMNVGGRLVKVDEAGKITYISPVVRQLMDLRVGEITDIGKLEELAQKLVQGLEMAAGLREKTALWDVLVTREAPLTQPAAPGVVISFSGGVADCIETDHPPFAFGDMGPILGRAIRKSRLCQEEYRLSEQTIRATVIGAGCHSAMLSGSTVFYRNVDLPVKNLPVVVMDAKGQMDADAIRRAVSSMDSEQIVLAMPGVPAPDYETVSQMARSIAEVTAGKPVYVCLQADMAKALGQRLALLLPEKTPCLCIDRVAPEAGDYLDVGLPVGAALPVVVKTLVLASNSE